MERPHVGSWIAIATLAVLSGFVTTPNQSREPKDPRSPKRIVLAARAVKSGSLRAGHDVKAAIPAVAYRAKLGATTIDFLDLDGDGRLQAGSDGMALADAPFVVPIPEALLLREGQFTLQFEGTDAVAMTPQDLGAWARLVVDASLLTELRIRGGVRPVALDLAACAAATKHVDYLRKNGLADGSAGVGMHDEDPKLPGYTPEGAAAGAYSDLAPACASLAEGIAHWHATAWHGVLMLAPEITRVGVEFQVDFAMLSFVPGPRVTRDFIHPPDGAVDVPLEFSPVGEVPTPVPGTEYAMGCGFPVYIRLATEKGLLESAELLDGAGKPVRGTFSSPDRPATAEWPTNSGLALFIPKEPLAQATTYTAKFKLAGRAEPVEWRFTTGKANAQRARRRR